jgi:hypothetical protein
LTFWTIRTAQVPRARPIRGFKRGATLIVEAQFFDKNLYVSYLQAGTRASATVTMKNSNGLWSSSNSLALQGDPARPAISLALAVCCAISSTSRSTEPDLCLSGSGVGCDEH